MNTYQKLGLAVVAVAFGWLVVSYYQANLPTSVKAIAFISTVCVGSFLLAYGDKPPH